MKKKKIVVIGGGTGLSTLLKGLKQFPVDLTAVVSVSDDGGSTGKLREEFNITAVGDIRRVIISLSEKERLVKELLNYRFKSETTLEGHTLGNLLLTGLIDISGNTSEAIKSLSKVLNLHGKVLPLTEDNVVLKAKMNDGKTIKGEHNITHYPSSIKKLYYEKDVKILDEVLEEIKKADLIVFSMGSLFTSVICNLIDKSITKAIDESKAKLVYVCNMMTQPGETDDYKVSDHINVINSYLGKKKIGSVIVNDAPIDKILINKYSRLEQKTPVILDKENIKINIITDKLISIEDNMIKHNTLKLGFHIFSHTL